MTQRKAPAKKSSSKQTAKPAANAPVIKEEKVPELDADNKGHDLGRDGAAEMSEEQEKAVLNRLKEKYEADFEDDGNDFNFHTVHIVDGAMAWIPGPLDRAPQVLSDWCREYATGKWKMLNDADWLFEKKEDAKAFEIAWNTRR